MQLADLAIDTPLIDRRARRVEITGVTADSRNVEPGYLFAALPGTSADGAAFLADALARGASAVLVPDRARLPAEMPVPVIVDADPRRRFAAMAARFFGAAPETVVAVTGTNGKTSVAAFVRQIWQANGIAAASMGTIGVVTPREHRPGNMTTPDPVMLHRTLSELKREGIEHVALEASSHGILQRRLDGARIAAAGFTNITRDHLDYHGTFEAYLAAKLRLFDTVLEPGARAVINADDRYAETIVASARINGLDVMTVGHAGTALRLIEVRRKDFSQVITVDAGDGPAHYEIPLVGEFQVSNALVAAGLAIAAGLAAKDALGALSTLTGAPGRLELVAWGPHGAPIFVDYAHTPDAISTALAALRPFVDRRLAIVFGAGGDRDRGKRAPMGAAAAAAADRLYVTDDNPRSEDPAAIRAAILEGAPDAIEIPDRQKAIIRAIADLRVGDVLLIAGKGHETGQTVGSVTLPFSDHDAVRKALPKDAGRMANPLWSSEELLAATGGRLVGTVSAAVRGISIDTRTLTRGDLFVALKGEKSDGHAHVEAALGKGAALCLVAGDRLASLPDFVRPLLAVDDVLASLEGIAGAARARTSAKIIAVTGSVGKTSTKDALRAVLSFSGPTHAAAASFNNHLGVPLTLARLDRTARFAVFELGMSAPGEIRHLVGMVRPHIAIVTAIAPAHLEHLGSIEAIVSAKAEVFEGVEPGGVAIINRDIPWFDLLAGAARARGLRVVGFGEDPSAEVRMLKCVLREDCSLVTATILGEPITYKVGVPGRHLVQNSLAVLAAVHFSGGNLALAGIALGQIRQPKGRGLRHSLRLGGGLATLIDESYNANPTSMRAALATIAYASGPGRRVVVLGDMLELGPESAERHHELMQPILEAGIHRVYCCGAMMRHLWSALPGELRGAYAETAEALGPIVEDDLRPGDVVMVKGSNGSRLVPLVEKLLARFAVEDDSALN